MGESANTFGFSSGKSSTSGKQSSSSRAVFDEQGQSLLNRVTNFQPSDLNSSTQAQIAAIQNSTSNDLPGIIASARSAGYNRPGNWGQGNVADAVAQRLAQRDVALSEAQTTAAMQQAQNEITNNQTLAALLSLLRGEDTTGTYKERSKQSGFNFTGAIK